MSCDPEKPLVPNSEPYIHIVHIFAASPDDLFDAWLQPNLLRRWMSFTGDGGAQDVIANHRVGGLFWIRERDGAALRDRYGEYHSIERPRRLVFSLHVPEHFPGTTCVNVSLAPGPNGTVMSFIHTGVRNGPVEATWRRMFDRLAESLECRTESSK